MVNTSSGAYEIIFQYKLFIHLWSLFLGPFRAAGIYYFDASRQLYQEMSARTNIRPKR